MQQSSVPVGGEPPPRFPRTRRRWSVRPYVARLFPQPGAAAVPEPWPAPVPVEVLQRVRDGLAALGERPASPPQPPRAAHARELAAQLRPLAWRARVALPAAWAPAEVNAPDPDVTTTAPLEVVGP